MQTRFRHCYFRIGRSRANKAKSGRAGWRHRKGGSRMIGQPIERTPSAHGYPLLIGGLLKSGVTRAPEQEIVYADKRRMAYRELGERVGRLASVSGRATWSVSWIGIPPAIWSVSLPYR